MEVLIRNDNIGIFKKIFISIVYTYIGITTFLIIALKLYKERMEVY